MPTADLSAGPIDYIDTGGDGPVIVLGHGLLMSGTVWRKVIPKLAGFRCIAPTFPLGAHRRPMRPDADLTQLGMSRIVAEFLEALGLAEVTLVLNDWGGGQFIIPDGRDDRVGRLVLASCEAFDNFPPKPARPAMNLCRMPGGTRVFTKLLGTQVFRHNPKLWGALSKHGVPDRVLDDWFESSMSDADIRRDLRKFGLGSPSRRTLLDWSALLPAFERPVLVVWATEDKMMPVAHAHRLVETFPNAQLVEIEDSWTLIPEDQPTQMAAALAAFAADGR